MRDSEKPTENLHFEDRSSLLILFGVFQLILAVLCLLGGVVVATFPILYPLLQDLGGSTAAGGQSISSPTMFSVTDSIFAALPLALAAVWFVWMGIGSIRARRWARSLTLVCSWITLAHVVLAGTFMCFVLPDMNDQLVTNQQISQNVAGRGTSVIAEIMLFFLVVLVVSAIFVLFYGGRNVKATCEHKDPQIRWTDQCPLPVLAISLYAAYQAVLIVYPRSGGWAIPLFGYVLQGFAGALFAAFVILLLGYVVVGTYRLNMKAWWCTLLLTIGSALSSAVTSLRVKPEFYEKMGLTPQELDTLVQFDMVESPSGIIYFFFIYCGYIAYLLYTRRYFLRQQEQATS